jgi:hypothetical protein
VELVRIERGGGEAMQSLEQARGRRCERARGVRPVGLAEPPGRVRPGRLAPTGGPNPTGGPGLAERERGFNQILKNRNLNKIKRFLEKPFNTQLKAEK